MTHHAITVSVPPLSLGVSLGLWLFTNSWQSLVGVVPATAVAPWWASIHATHHALPLVAIISITVPPLSLGVSLGLWFFTNSSQSLVWVVPATVVAPWWASIHATHHALALVAIVSIAVPPLSLGVSLGLRLFIDSRQGLVWVVPVVAPWWASVIHVAHHAVVHHIMTHHAITVSVPPFSLGVRLVIYRWECLVWVVPSTIAPRWTSIVPITHPALTLIAITIWVHPFACGLGLSSWLSGNLVVGLLTNDNIGLVGVIPPIAPGWTTMVGVAHHAILHHAMAHHSISTAIWPLALWVNLGLGADLDGLDWCQGTD